MYFFNYVQMYIERNKDLFFESIYVKEEKNIFTIVLDSINIR